jgi:cardiolipin synthase
MTFLDFWGWALVTLHVALQAAFVVRALLRPNRDPSARMAWVVVIVVAPVFGMLAYILFGEARVGKGRVERLRLAASRLSLTDPRADADAVFVDPRRAHVFEVGRSISGFRPLAGNTARLMADSDAAIDSIVADMDAATDHIHLLFYIWLDDGNGRKIAEAAIRAAARGITVRAMVDDLGSRGFIKSAQWKSMDAAGVKLARALRIGNPLMRALKGRIDLRDHRKIVVIDNRITYCGSQNCADPAFLVKAKYAPWVDLMVRFEGPIARQNQWLFAQDWMVYFNEDLADILGDPVAPLATPGIVAQAIGTGPTVRASAMPEMFETLMHAARTELVLTTPYYVPSEPMQAALCASARRGVPTTIVFPARNDSRIVAAASQSYYADLLEAGVRIFEYPLGLLHTKSLTLDAEMALIGSANLDRRSFDLNYENNILFEDRALTRDIRARQQSYIDASREVLPEEVAAWRPRHRLLCNAVAMFGPVL